MYTVVIPERFVPERMKGEPDMLGDISGYSVDKAKFVLECTPEEAVTMSRMWHDIFGDEHGPQGGKVYSTGSLKKGTTEGTYLYFWDVWGEHAQRVDELPFEEWFPLLSRVDLKIPMPMTPDGRDNYHQYLKEKIGENRSVRIMDSPPRQKRGSRDGGGHTLALGSHKSDFRVHWTLRTNEEGYQEFQLEGSRIEREISFQRTWQYKPEQYAYYIGWQHMMESLLTHANIELSDIDGLYDSDRAEILAGRIDVHGVLERKLDYIEHMLDRLPRSALFGLYDALNEKLFGTAADVITPDDVDRAVERLTRGA